MNKVIAGEFENQIIVVADGKVKITDGKKGRIIDSMTVVSYEVLDEEKKKSLASGITRGLVGGALLGGVGMVAGVVTAKSKGTHQIAVEFVDGKKSLLEVDDKMYKMIVNQCFDTGKPKLTAEELVESDKVLYKKGKNGLRGCLIAFLVVVALLTALIVWIAKLPDADSTASEKPAAEFVQTEN